MLGFGSAKRQNESYPPDGDCSLASLGKAMGALLERVNELWPSCDKPGRSEPQVCRVTAKNQFFNESFVDRQVFPDLIFEGIGDAHGSHSKSH